MSNFNDSPGYDPKNLQVVFMAFLSAQIIFLLIALYIIDDPDFFYRIDDIVFTLIPIFALILDIAGNRVFANGFSKLGSDGDIEKDLIKLNNLHILRWGLVEGATLLLICFSIITTNHFFSAFAAANIVYFYTLKPKIFTFNEGF